MRRWAAASLVESQRVVVMLPPRRGKARLLLLSADSDLISGRLISGLWDPYCSLPKLCSELDASDVYTLRRIVPKDRGFNWE